MGKVALVSFSLCGGFVVWGFHAFQGVFVASGFVVLLVGFGEGSLCLFCCLAVVLGVS